MSHCVPNWGVESLATHKPPPGAAHAVHRDSFHLVPWFDGKASEGKPDATARDAVVPCAVPGEDDVQVAPDSEGGCTRVGSCSGPVTWEFSKVGDAEDDEGSVNASSFACVPVADDWSSEEGVSVSLDMSDDSFGGDSRRVPTMSSSEWELSESMTTSSFFSLENTFSTSKTSDTNNTTSSNDNHRSVSRNSNQRRDRGSGEKGTSKSSIPTKRSRCRANQSQRKRREKMDHNMKKLQRLVPTSKMGKDKEWVLDEVIEYIKQLQGQVHLLMSMMMPMPMMPMSMPQQLVHMPMMPAHMPMGMGPMCMGMGHRQNLVLPCLSPAVYMPAPAWNVAAAGQLPAHANPQSHWPMTMEAHSRLMASSMQQQHPFIFQNGNFF